MTAADAVAVRRATLADIDWVKVLCARHTKQIGFVLRPALVEAVGRGELLVARGPQGYCGFCHYHTRRDGWTVVYEIVSVRAGAGRAMFAALPRPLRLKCPVDNVSNGFYAHIGGTLAGVDPGKKRPLNIWEWPA